MPAPVPPGPAAAMARMLVEPVASAPGETGMTLSWQPAPLPEGAAGLVLEVREFPQDWDLARQIPLQPEARELRVTGLLPTGTFEFRLRYRLSDGTLSAPGPHATADTLAAGCTPKSSEPEDGGRRKKCVVQ